MWYIETGQAEAMVEAEVTEVDMVAVAMVATAAVEDTLEVMEADGDLHHPTAGVPMTDVPHLHTEAGDIPAQGVDHTLPVSVLLTVLCNHQF